VSASKEFNFQMSTTMKDRLVYGCLVLKKALNQTINQEVISNGFKDSGWFPLNFTTMMDLCYHTIPQEMRERMLGKSQIRFGHVSSARIFV
jgi:hypothetical protein